MNEKKVINWNYAIPIIEKALNITLYDWQEKYLKDEKYVHGGRRTGKTLIHCVKLILTREKPVCFRDIENYIDEYHGSRYYAWFSNYFIEIHEKLKASGLPVVELLSRRLHS